MSNAPVASPKTSVPLMRAFVALNLDVESVRRLAEIARALRSHRLAPKARWVPPTKMHVTLKFLGDVDVGLELALREALTSVPHGMPELRMGIEALSAFPSVTEARVIVALLSDDQSGGLARWADAVEESVDKLGLSRESRLFRPHVTLARPSHAVNVEAWLSSVAPNISVARATELVLYRSDLRTGQNEYVALARFGLGGAST